MEPTSTAGARFNPTMSLELLIVLLAIGGMMITAVLAFGIGYYKGEHDAIIREVTKDRDGE